MNSKHLSISIEEFRLMDHPFGWKAEYFNGKAHLTPREYIVRTQLKLQHQAIYISDRIVPVDPLRQEQMIETFSEAFEDSVEFCDWPLEEINIHARKNITNYFRGTRGTPHPASRMVLELDCDPLSLRDAPRAEGLRQRIIGLALFTEKEPEQIDLDLLLVQPSQQRMGIATQMVASATNSLYAAGVRDLTCGYHVCNDHSRDWQYKFGFEDILEYFYCKSKAAWYRNEIWRWEKLGEILHRRGFYADRGYANANERIEELSREKDRWEQLIQDLEPNEPL